MSKQEKSGLELAESKYTLVDPIPASEALWNAYTAERRAVRRAFGNVLSDKKKHEEDEYAEIGDGSVALAVFDAVRKMEIEFGLPKNSLRSGTSILYNDSSFEEENQPRTVSLLTRVYSVSSPSSVDLHLTYHCRSRMESIEWYIGIGYKINSRPSSNRVPTSSNIIRQIGLPDGSNFSLSMYSGNGWNTFYKAFYDDEMGFSGRRWKRYEVKEVGLYEDGLREVHDVLLGPHPCMDNDTPTSASESLKRQRLVRTARLLLACVGVECAIACNDSERDELPSSRNAIDWMLEGVPSWFAREVRKAAGFQLERDPEGAQKYAQAVKDEIRGWDNDEYGSDEEYGYRF